MTNKEFLNDLLFRHDLINIIYKDSKKQYYEYEAEARHIEQQLLLGIPFKTAIHDIFSFFFRNGELIPVADKVARVEAEYYNHISKYNYNS